MMRQRLLFLLLVSVACTVVRAQKVRLTNLPTIRIETYDGSDITSKNTYKPGSLVYIDEEDRVTRYDSVSIRGRGNSTWLMMAKKAYRIKFQKKTKFLGPGYANAKSWTLLANAGDKSMIRNALTSAMGKRLGLAFNPAYKFVDLYLNGTYRGTYQISDQVQVKSHRVDICEQEEPVDATSDVSGGYLLEADGFADFADGKTGFHTSKYKVPVRVHSPDEDVIAARQLQYIRDYVNAFEDRLHGNFFADASRGYRPFVDSLSLANWYLATEISANVDGFFSTYFYKNRADSLLYWGPLWDYDIAYNNDNRTDRGTGPRRTSVTTYQLMADVAYTGTKDWVNRMWEDPWFGRLVNRRFADALAGGLEAYLVGVVDSLATLLAQSQELNYELWGIDKRVYHEMVLYSSYDDYVSSLKRFITAHLRFLSSKLPARTAQKQPVPTAPFTPELYYYRIYSASTQHAFDIRQDLAVTNADDTGSKTQEWWLRAVGERFMIVNRQSGQALNDPSVNVTATSGMPRQLNMTVPNTLDDRQLWTFVPQGTDGYYNILNAATGRTVNLGGGSRAGNAPVLSYVSGAGNATTASRLWRFCKTDLLPDRPTVLWQVAEPDDYALAYNPVTQQLHFGSATPDALGFMAAVYSASGVKIGQFRASESFSLQGQPAGMYIVKWLGHSRKFLKR